MPRKKQPRARRTRRRNPLSRSWMIVLAVMASVVTFGAVGFALMSRRQLKELTGALGEVAEDLRLPQPDFAVHLPIEPEDYAVISEVVCECTDEKIAPGQEIQDVEQVLVEIQRCAAMKLIPDFPWPPISGDHATVSTLWNALGYEAGRHLVMNNLCSAKKEGPR